MRRVRGFAGVAMMLAGLVLAGCDMRGGSGSTHARRAQEYYRAGNLDKARVEYLSAAKVDPQNAAYREGLGEVAEAAGNLVEAFSHYSAALERDPGLSSARADQVRLMVLGDRTEDALAAVEQGLKLDPGSPALLAARASISLQRGDLATARGDAETAFSRDPYDPQIATVLAAVQRRQDDLPGATRVIREALSHDSSNGELHAVLADLLELAGDFPAAERELRLILSLRPDALRYRLRLARFYQLRANMGMAEAQFREAVRSAPERADVRVQLLAFIARVRGVDAAFAELDRMLRREGDNWPLRLEMGRKLAADGLFDQARRLLEPVLAQDGDVVAGDLARVEMASLEHQAGQSETALALLAPVLERNSQNAEALAIRGKILSAKGRHREAVADLRVVLRTTPDSVPALIAISEAYLGSGSVELAEDSLRRALELDPFDATARLAQARIHNRSGRFAEAASGLAELARERPADRALQETLFAAHVGKRDWNAARSVAQSLQSAIPADPLGYRLAALVEEFEGRPNEALALYRRALAVSSRDHLALAALIRVLVGLQRKEEARQAVDLAIRSDPGAAPPRVLLAELHLAAGRLADAEQEFLQAERLGPADPQVYRSLAIVQLAGNREAAAYATLQRGIERSSQPIDLVTELAAMLELRDRSSQAIDVYRWSREKFPDSAMIANNLAMLLVSYRRDAASLAEAEALADLLVDYREPGFIDTRGWVKYHAGKSAQAETLLQQAVDLAPGAHELHYHLAVVQMARGRRDLALRNFEMALRGNPDYFGVEEARSQLRRLQGLPVQPR